MLKIVQYVSSEFSKEFKPAKYYMVKEEKTIGKELHYNFEMIPNEWFPARKFKVLESRLGFGWDKPRKGECYTFWHVKRPKKDSKAMEVVNWTTTQVQNVMCIGDDMFIVVADYMYVVQLVAPV